MADRPERRWRGSRLREAFPEVYDTRPNGSALGVLLDSLAGSLSTLDNDIQQALFDRWLRLASGDPIRGRSPLDELTRLSGMLRLPGELTPSLRFRALGSARPLREGGTTPRALMNLVATALGAELCPKLRRVPPKGGERVTNGDALSPVVVRRCGACGGQGPCPNSADALFRVKLIENPPTPRTQRFASLQPGTRFSALSDSLDPARPTLIVRANQDGVSYPAVRSGRETVLFAGQLNKGEALIIVPLDSADERRGTARIEAEDSVRLVTERVFYLVDRARFDEVNFTDDHGTEPAFAAFEDAGVRTPELPPGSSEWSYVTLGREELVSTFGTEKVQQTFSDVPDSPSTSRADVELTWTSYPPAAFRLEVPRTPWVRRLEALGGLDLVQRIVENTRPCGVSAVVDFPQDHSLTDTAERGFAELWLDPQITHVEPQPMTAALTLATDASGAERLGLDDGALDTDDNTYREPLFSGRFGDREADRDGTPFNWSRFALEDT